MDWSRWEYVALNQSPWTLFEDVPEEQRLLVAIATTIGKWKQPALYGICGLCAYRGRALGTTSCGECPVKYHCQNSKGLRYKWLKSYGQVRKKYQQQIIEYLEKLYVEEYRRVFG